MRAAPAALAALALLGAGCADPAGDEPAGAGAIPPSERWEAIARELGGPENPASPNVCNRGERACVEEVVSEMRRRFDVLAAACDHKAAFAFMYLQVTEGVGDDGTRIFRDPEYLNHLDAVFAHLYFSAFDSFTRGNDVPAAWRVAFEAADARRVTGLGDMLLGMNAHISRDLPFALADIGLETAEGESGRPDYDRVNGLLADVQEPMLAAASELLDPSIAGFRLDALDFSARDVADLIATWRSEAYRNAETLIAAPTPAARAKEAARIERNAESRARVLEMAMSYALLGETTAERDAYCARRTAG
ncbi:MAG: DUF5995 family protein [Thermoleophilaceae bacterium]